MLRRTLVLKKESLQELAAPELAAVAGGQPVTYGCYTAGLQCFVNYSLNYCQTVDCIKP